MKTKLPLPLPKLQKKADRLFSVTRRMQEADENGYCYCITCGVRRHWKEMDAGHFINRGYLATRYDLINVWPQCKKCNRFRSGDHSKYRDNLVSMFGLETVEKLEKKKYETVIFARSLYEKVIEECK